MDKFRYLGKFAFQCATIIMKLLLRAKRHAINFVIESKGIKYIWQFGIRTATISLEPSTSMLHIAARSPVSEARISNKGELTLWRFIDIFCALRLREPYHASPCSIGLYMFNSWIFDICMSRAQRHNIPSD